VAVPASAGDGVVLDYRLLHATHENASTHPRGCLLLSFAPSWGDLPTDIQAHLVRHPALPQTGERPPCWLATVLPRFVGKPGDLPLNRVPPADFELAD
jgi:hypothetical protein